MRALYYLVFGQRWQMTITHIQSLADGDAVEQLFFQNGDEWTAIM